ncbi:hypothetical protein L2735_11975 [Shewanella olleyana]|uniref:hypothetical protein n=1 Tax=Shewanella olleyana TaxID=135626 RepID=UPI00200DCF38|nr:hypothetical protein [Shewanella olleyana]MCL1067516.1 hypothetical protein [Shewanella olleyana]
MKREQQSGSSTFADTKLNKEVMNDLRLSASELNSLWKGWLQLQAHTQGWSKATLELFLLEFSNSVAAFKKLIVCQLLLVMLLPMFLFSLAVGAGVVNYYFTLNLVAGFGTFILTFAIIMLGLLVQQKYIMQFVGFHHTKQQLKEGLDVCTQQTKKANSNEEARRQKASS